MRKTLILSLLAALLIVGGVRAQTIGTNGQGLMQTSTQHDWDLLKVFDFPFIVRYPGGADTKFALTDAKDGIIRGWDMSIDTIKAHYAAMGTDENDSEDGLDKYTRKYNEQELTTIDYHKRLVELNNYVPNHQVMYNFNVFYSGKDRAMVQLDSLVARGVRVPAVVFNNETYGKSQYKFTFEEYRKDFEPYAIKIKAKYPWMKIGLCLAPDSESGSHTTWNNALFAYAAAHPNLIDAVDVHLYYNEKVLPLSWAAMPTAKQVIRFDVKDQKLNDAWTTFYNEASSSRMIEDKVAYIKSKAPNLNIWCSEMNANPMSKWSNTVAHGAFMFRKLVENAPSFEYLMVQNGIGSDIGSMISPKQEQDLSEDVNVIRVHYYSVLFAGTCLQNKAVDINKLMINEPGTYFAYYAQIGAAAGTANVFVPSNLKVTSITNVFVSGEFAYSSAGALALMKKVRDGQVKTYDIDGYYVSDNDSIAPNSFGFIIYTVEPKQIVVCRDTTVIIGYETTYVNDTVVIPGCDECSGWWFRIWNKRFCRDCKATGGIQIITSEVLTPKYGTITVCDTIDVGYLPRKTVVPYPGGAHSVNDYYAEMQLYGIRND